MEVQRWFCSPRSPANRPSPAGIAQLAKLRDLARRQRLIEDRQLVQAPVPHIEVALFRRSAREIQLRADRQGSDARVAMQLVVASLSRGVSFRWCRIKKSESLFFYGCIRRGEL